MARLVIVLAGLALALAMPACGGGSSGGPTDTGPAPTRAQFVKKANAICVKGDEEISAVYGQYAGKTQVNGKPVTEARMNKVAESIVLPVRKKELRLLRAMGAPPGEDQRVERILAAIEEGIENGERDRRTLRATDGTEYAFTKALELEVNYGLVKCGLG